MAQVKEKVITPSLKVPPHNNEAEQAVLAGILINNDAINQVMDIFRDVAPVIEPLSLDEAYMDVTENVTPETMNLVAFDLKVRVLAEMGLVVTIGGGTSKTVAKVASQVAKPNGLLLVKPGDERAFLAPLEIGLLPGVGPKSGTVLKEHGIKTMGDLATCEEESLHTCICGALLPVDVGAPPLNVVYRALHVVGEVVRHKGTVVGSQRRVPPRGARLVMAEILVEHRVP